MTLLISARVSPVTFSSPGILLIAANEQVLISVNINHTQVNILCWYGIQVYANYKTHKKRMLNTVTILQSANWKH